MNAEQMETFIGSLIDRLDNGVNHTQAASLVPHLSERVSWSQFPRLDLTLSTEIDTWFLSFEARMKAARVPEEKWASKFIECPFVEERVKVRMRDLEPFAYFHIRQRILSEHGPIDPVNFFKREIYRTRGDNAEDVREALMKLLTLHNRAALDDGVEPLKEQDLCYPFLEAFPAHTRAALERQLALVFAQDNPFEHLYRLAPIKQRGEVEACQIATDESGGLQRSVTDILALALQKTQGQWDRSKRCRVDSLRSTGDSHKAIRSPCRNCGRECSNLPRCPAANKKCFSCGEQGHLERTCQRGH